MSKIAVAGAVVIIVGAVAGGGYYYTSQKIHQIVGDQIKQIEQNVPGLSITYASSNVDVFSGTATLNKVVAKDGRGQVYEAETVTLARPKDDLFPKISIYKFRTKTGNNISYGFAHGDVENLKAALGAVTLKNGSIDDVDPSKISFDQLNLENAFLESTDGSKMTFAQYQVKDFGVGHQSNQTLKQLYFTFNDNGVDSVLKIGEFQASKVDLARVTVAARQLSAASGDMTKFAAIANKMSRDSLSKNTEEQSVILDNIEMTSGSYAVSLSNCKVTSQVKNNGDIQANYSWNGFKFQLSPNDRDTLALRQMGYNTLDFSGSMGINYVKDSQLLSLAPFELTIKDIGKVNLSMKMIGDLNSIVSPSRIFAPGYSLDTDPAFSQFKLDSFKFTWQDQGIFNRGLKWTAQENNQDPEQMKQALIDQLDNQANNASNTIVKQFYQAGAEFMKNPTKIFTMTVNTKTPISMSDLRTMSPYAILDQVKVSFETSNPK